MPVTPLVHEDPEALGAAAAALIADRIEAAGARPFLLGCPGGRSASTTYAALAAEVEGRGLDLRDLVIVMMDDYLVPAADGSLRREDPRAAHSCERFGREVIVAPLNAVAAPGAEIPAENLWVPDPSAPEVYDTRISAHGGIDLFLLASGASDGHIAFNPPGSEVDSRTRIVRLPDTTRRDNLSTFPTFEGDLDRVPTHGVTVGLGTIKELSREVLMLVHGRDKQLAVERLSTATVFDPSWPATIFVECAAPHLFVDASYAGAAAVTH